MKKLIFTGLIAFGLFSFKGNEEVKQVEDLDVFRCCTLWMHVTTIDDEGRVSTESYCQRWDYNRDCGPTAPPEQ